MSRAQSIGHKLPGAPSRKDQRRAVPNGDPQDATDDDLVIPAIVSRMPRAIEPRQRAAQGRQPFCGDRMVQAVEPRTTPREPRHPFRLSRLQHVDREMRSEREHFKPGRRARG